MCVGPNGDVYPCQSYLKPRKHPHEPLDSKIWNHPTARKSATANTPKPNCKDCPQLQVCGGGCPLENQSKTARCIVFSMTSWGGFGETPFRAYLRICSIRLISKRFKVRSVECIPGQKTELAVFDVKASWFPKPLVS
jgi:radical SAM protein with 4Fe4S-binding SPASM domain